GIFNEWNVNVQYRLGISRLSFSNYHDLKLMYKAMNNQVFGDNLI
ncbi:MAG: hypothetical protein ACI9J3_004004, partial [Parvicellaceae bacterium]